MLRRKLIRRFWSYTSSDSDASAWYRCTLVLILRELQFHTLCREFITEQASPILRRTYGRQSIRTLLTAKVDELLYSFNWYTIYEDC